MAKKAPKPKAAKAPKAAKSPKAGSSKPRAAWNVYTAMSLMATLMLVATLVFVLLRSGELFGSIGDLFNLQSTNNSRQVQRSAPAAAAPEATSAENQ